MGDRANSQSSSSSSASAAAAAVSAAAALHYVISANTANGNAMKVPTVNNQWVEIAIFITICELFGVYEQSQALKSSASVQS